MKNEQLVKIATYAPIDRRLTFSTSTSRGHDTYGYPIMKLKASRTGEVFKCMGGGYDMIGTCLGQYIKSLTDEYAEIRQALTTAMVKQAKEGHLPYGLTVRGEIKKKDGSFNLTKIKENILNGDFYLEGGCGENCMIRIAESMGLIINSDYQRSTRKGTNDKFLGYNISLDPKGLIVKEFAKSGAVL